MNSRWYPNELVKIKQIPCFPTRKNCYFNTARMNGFAKYSSFQALLFVLPTLARASSHKHWCAEKHTEFWGVFCRFLKPTAGKKHCLYREFGVTSAGGSLQGLHLPRRTLSFCICLTSSKMKCISTYFTWGMKYLVSLGVAEITRSEKIKGLWQHEVTHIYF